MIQKRHWREPVPIGPGFQHLAPGPSGTPGEAGALNDDQNDKRGRPSRERGADDMIEQRSSPERRKASAALDEARLRQQAIGVRLRQMFDEVVNEDVPDEFLDILRRADERNAGGGE
jgi:hypothetical protein